MELKYTNNFETSWGDYSKKLLTSKTGDWRSTRPELNRDACRLCGWCSMVCPSGCVRKCDDGYLHSDLDYCKGCGICAFECPANALVMVMEPEA